MISAKDMRKQINIAKDKEVNEQKQAFLAQVEATFKCTAFLVDKVEIELYKNKEYKIVSNYNLDYIFTPHVVAVIKELENLGYLVTHKMKMSDGKVYLVITVPEFKKEGD